MGFSFKSSHPHLLRMTHERLYFMVLSARHTEHSTFLLLLKKAETAAFLSAAPASSTEIHQRLLRTPFPELLSVSCNRCQVLAGNQNTRYWITRPVLVGLDNDQSFCRQASITLDSISKSTAPPSLAKLQCSLALFFLSFPLLGFYISTKVFHEHDTTKLGRQRTTATRPQQG